MQYLFSGKLCHRDIFCFQLNHFLIFQSHVTTINVFPKFIVTETKPEKSEKSIFIIWIVVKFYQGTFYGITNHLFISIIMAVN